MGALNIRDIGDDRKAALEAEARAQGLSVSELVRRLLDQGIRKARADRAREEWLAEAREGLAFEAERLRRRGPSLARHRKVPGAGDVA
jgi:post-segregation antitoxin (ccd killing protein)